MPFDSDRVTQQLQQLSQRATQVVPLDALHHVLQQLLAERLLLLRAGPGQRVAHVCRETQVGSASCTGSCSPFDSTHCRCSRGCREAGPGPGAVSGCPTESGSTRACCPQTSSDEESEGDGDKNKTRLKYFLVLVGLVVLALLRPGSPCCSGLR